MRALKTIFAFLLLGISALSQVTIKGGTTTTGTVVANPQAVSATYYVSPTGSDSNNGTSIGTPFLTLDHARSAARSLVGTQTVTILFLGGTYYNQATTFGSLDSGTSTYPVIYKNYPGQTPILSGGIRITGWTNINGQSICNGVTPCWQVSIPNTYTQFERLWYNGAIRYRPRYGASGGNLLGAWGHVGNASSTISNLSLTSNVLTVTVTNNFVATYQVFFSGITNGSWTFLNGTSCVVSSTGLSTSAFSCPYTNTNVSSTAIAAGIATETAPTNNTAFSYNDADTISSYASCAVSPNDCEYTHFAKWTASVQRVSAINATNQTITSTCSGGNCPNGGSGEYQVGWRYSFENAKELLLYAGQWYLDRSSTNPNYPNWTLTYLGNTGENPNTDTVVIPQNQIVSGSGVSYVTFQGLTFEHSNYVIPSTGYSSTQLDPNLPLTASTLGFTGSSYITITQCTIAHTVGNGIEILAASSYFTMSYLLMYDLGGYGVRIGHQPNSADTDATVPQHNLLTQSYIWYSGLFFGSGDAVMGGDAHDNEISFNDLAYTSHDGVEWCMPLGGYCGGTGSSNGPFNNNIHDNDIHNIMQGLTDDGGGIYMQVTKCCGGIGTAQSATGNVVNHNRIHDVNDASTQDTDGYGGQCIYLDSYSGLTTVENNLCYRVSANGFKMSIGPQVANQPNTVENNVISRARQNSVGDQDCPYNSSTVQIFVFENNIVYADRNNSSTPETNIQYGSVYLPNSPPTQNINYASNIYYNPNGFVTAKEFYHHTACSTTSGSNGQGTGLTWFSNFAAWQTFGEDAGSTITTNPNFTAPTNCTTSSTYWPYPTPGTCDDYTLSVSPGYGFVVFTQTFGPTVKVSVPSVLPTFITATYNPATDF